MDTIKKEFLESINNTTNILVLHDYLEQNHFDAIDYSDILRWLWVQSLSVLDKFVHDLVLTEMVSQFLNNEEKTVKLMAFKFTADQVKNIIDAASLPERENIIRTIFSEKNSYETYQDPDKICDALSYIWIEKHKLQKISLKMGLKEYYVKTKLKNIVARRNQIAHQNDIQSYDFEKMSISKSTVKDVIAFIKDFGEAIYKCLNEK